MASTLLERDVRRRVADTRRGVGAALRELREDAGLTVAAVARAAGLDRSFLARVETGERAASVETLVAVATVLGAELAVRAYPTTGPRIRDRVSAAMTEGLLPAIHPRWVRDTEVLLRRPARGVADLVLHDDPATVVVEGELHSQLRRLEQQVRWHREKEASLPSADLWRFLVASGAPDAPPPATSRLLVLRSTRELRGLVDAFGETLRVAYPAPARAACEAITGGTAPWPGASIVWMDVTDGRARLLPGPPRGVAFGRR